MKGREIIKEDKIEEFFLYSGRQRTEYKVEKQKKIKERYKRRRNG